MGYGRIVVPVSVQAQHSFVDGILIGHFADMLQEYVEAFLTLFRMDGKVSMKVVDRVFKPLYNNY